MTDQELQNLIPETLREIVGLIGLDQAMAFTENYGGQRVYIPAPQRLGPDHPFAELLGHGPALKLAAGIAIGGGGVELMIPRAHAYRRAVRNRAIVAELAQGMTAPKLARKYGMTEGAIYRINAAHKRHPNPKANTAPTPHDTPSRKSRG